MLLEGSITQEEALGNADSATNLLWLINNTEAGISMSQGKAPKTEAETKAMPVAAPAPSDGSFSQFKLDVNVPT
jgi:twitching motility protein PilU